MCTVLSVRESDSHLTNFFIIEPPDVLLDTYVYCKNHITKIELDEYGLYCLYYSKNKSKFLYLNVNQTCHNRVCTL